MGGEEESREKLFVLDPWLMVLLLRRMEKKQQVC